MMWSERANESTTGTISKGAKGKQEGGGQYSRGRETIAEKMKTRKREGEGRENRRTSDGPQTRAQLIHRTLDRVHLRSLEVAVFSTPQKKTPGVGISEDEAKEAERDERGGEGSCGGMTHT